MWVADKLIYRGDESFVRAYQGNSLVWGRNTTKIIYTSKDGQVVNPYDSTVFGGANILSNT